MQTLLWPFAFLPDETSQLPQTAHLQGTLSLQPPTHLGQKLGQLLSLAMATGSGLDTFIWIIIVHSPGALQGNAIVILNLQM